MDIDMVEYSLSGMAMSAAFSPGIQAHMSLIHNRFTSNHQLNQAGVDRNSCEQLQLSAHLAASLCLVPSGLSDLTAVALCFCCCYHGVQLCIHADKYLAGPCLSLIASHDTVCGAKHHHAARSLFNPGL